MRTGRGRTPHIGPFGVVERFEDHPKGDGLLVAGNLRHRARDGVPDLPRSVTAASGTSSAPRRRDAAGYRIEMLERFCQRFARAAEGCARQSAQAADVFSSADRTRSCSCSTSSVIGACCGRTFDELRDSS